MSSESKTLHKDERVARPSAVREFIVEFLGSLVPGIAFLFAILPALVIPIATIALTFLPHPKVPLPSLQGAIPASVSDILFLLFPLLMGFFVFVYIAGHLFYRQNPKIADEASFKRISKAEDKNEINDRACRELVVEDAAGNKTTKTPVEFPYHFP